MRILGLDYGSLTVGVAVTDALGMTAQGLTILRRDQENKLRKTLREIEEIVREYDVTTIAVGLPLNIDGTEGERCEKARAFAAMVESRTHVPVVMVDERLTSVEAEELMGEAGLSKAEKKNRVDQVAAVLILEDYLHGLQ